LPESIEELWENVVGMLVKALFGPLRRGVQDPRLLVAASLGLAVIPSNPGQR
jgi:hypothetical protein